jgi:hypothetical protein
MHKGCDRILIFLLQPLFNLHKKINLNRKKTNNVLKNRKKSKFLRKDTRIGASPANDKMLSGIIAEEGGNFTGMSDGMTDRICRRRDYEEKKSFGFFPGSIHAGIEHGFGIRGRD